MYKPRRSQITLLRGPLKISNVEPSSGFPENRCPNPIYVPKNLFRSRFSVDVYVNRPLTHLSRGEGDNPRSIPYSRTLSRLVLPSLTTPDLTPCSLSSFPPYPSPLRSRVSVSWRLVPIFMTLRPESHCPNLISHILNHYIVVHQTIVYKEDPIYSNFSSFIREKKL